MTSKDKLIENIDNTINSLDILKTNLSLSSSISNENLFDIQELIDLIDTNLEVSIYKLDKNLPITNKSIENRIKEYEIEKKILEPFLPSILLYSMVVNSAFQ